MALNATLQDEKPSFLLPENKMVFEIVDRARSVPGFETDQPVHPYIITCLDEFTRNWCTVSIAPDDPNHIESAIYDTPPDLKYPIVDDQELPTEENVNQEEEESEKIVSRVLQHYHPGYPAPKSTFKRVPPPIKHLLADRPITDVKVLIEVEQLNKPVQEPIFGTLAFYTLRPNEEFVRVTETFHFDLTPAELQERYQDVYITGLRDINDVTTAATEMMKVDPVTLVRKALFEIPADLKNNNLFLVAQLTKVLTGDSDKAIEPYVKKSKLDTAKVDEACRRLANYRQPLAYGAIRVFNETGGLQESSSELRIPLYGLKQSLSEEGLGQHVKELLVDSTHDFRDKLMNIDLAIYLYDLDTTFDLPPHLDGGLIVDAQFNSLRHGQEACTNLGPNVPTHAVRSLLPLPPPSLQTDDVTRRVNTCLNNTLFVYPLNLDRFNHRNLTVKVELVEMTSAAVDPSSALPLRNVYNHLKGPVFCTEAFTSVNYHNKSPVLNEEIKIRLPDVVTDRHYLVFTVMHVHVKPKEKTQRRGLTFGNRAAPAVPGEASAQVIGFGVLPILHSSHTLLPDIVHTVPILADEEAMHDLDEDEEKSVMGESKSSSNSSRKASITPGQTGPIISVRTKALSSIQTQDDKVFAFLRNQPPPMGRLPSSILEKTPPPNQDEIDEDTLVEVTKNLRDANAQDCNKHFLVIIRQLLRIMCGGTGIRRPEFENPHAHPRVRCEAFLSLLQLFGKIAPDVHAAKEGDRGTEEELLEAWVEYLLDEEVYVPKENESSSKVPEADEIDVEMQINEAAEHVLTEGMDVIVLEAMYEQIDKLIAEDKTANVSRTGGPGLFELAKQAGVKWWNTLAGASESKDTDSSDESRTLRRSDTMDAPEFEDDSFKLHTAEGVNEVTLQPFKPRWDKLKGYTHGRGSGTGADAQWWPWVYEVLVQQYYAVLCTVQGIDAEEREDADEDESYPFTKENIPTSSEAAKDTRSLALGHGGILLRMIVKSIAIRIHREGKKAPVILDDYFLTSLESLIKVLANEIASRVRGLWNSRKMNTALAQFIRTLFGLVAPLQVCQLVRAYFSTMRKRQKTEEVDLRLHFMEELCGFDQAVAVNCPKPLARSQKLPNQRRRPDQMQASGTMLRGIKNPSPHWLAELLIDEVQAAIAHDEMSIREKGVAILRDLLVRHSYDERYKDGASRQRVAAMYLPLLESLVSQVDQISEMKSTATLRRELLAMLLYLLQDCPDALLRDMWKELCRPGLFKPSAPVNLPLMPTGASPLALSSKHSARLHKDRRVSATTPEVPQSELQVSRMMRLLHCILDTFEFPFSQGEMDLPTRILVPGLKLPGEDDASSSGTGTWRRHANKGVDALSKLDQMMKTTKNARANLRTQRLARPTGGERKWRSHATQVSKSTIKQLTVSAENLHPATVMGAARWLSHEATSVVLRTVMMMVEECTPVLTKLDQEMPVGSAGVRAAVGSQKVASQSQNRNEMFMALVCRLLLHGLSMHQSDLALGKLFSGARVLLRRFGARLFISSCGDTVQDWLRCTVQHCNARRPRLRQNAGDFLLYLMRSTFHFTGSISQVTQPLLGVYTTSLFETVQANMALVRTTEDYERVLIPLRETLRMIAEGHGSTNAAFNDTARQLAIDLAWILDATIQTHQYLPDPAKYFYDGSNGLDAPSEATAGQGSKSGTMRMGDAPVLPADPEGMQWSLRQAATIHDALVHPRLKIFWLEQLALLQELLGHTVEAGVVRLRIFQTMQRVRTVWPTLWAPRPALAHPDATTSFVSILETALAKPALHAWATPEQLQTHMMATLSSACDRFVAAGLLHLAEKCCTHMIWELRRQGRLAEIAAIYGQLHSAFKDTNEASVEFAMGTYFRVAYFGAVPEDLKNKEFIYRNGRHLHLSEFTDLIKRNLQNHVEPGAEIKLLPDSSDESKIEADTNVAFIKLTALRPVREPQDVETPPQSVGGGDLIMAGDYLSDPGLANEVVCFKFSVPFTKKGKAHGEITEQFKRTTFLYVEEPFPGSITRQQVIRRQVRVLTPIEVAIDDIDERVHSMAEMLLRPDKTTDKNNLMRLVQGSVMPQVNAGAAEVARLFLQCDPSSGQFPAIEGVEEEAAAVQRKQLKAVMFDFLVHCKNLLAKSQRMLKSSTGGSEAGERGSVNLSSGDSKESHRTGSMLGGVRESRLMSGMSVMSRENSVSDETSEIWLQEMQAGFQRLVESVHPLISEIVGAAELLRMAQEKDYSA